MREPVVFTIGHGARTIDAFLDLLEVAGVRLLVDVRTAPASRKHPHFAKDPLAEQLHRRGLEYDWRGRDLGGWRRARPDSRHVELRSSGFRGYADHMETADFAAAREALIETARNAPTAVMCAESLWWRCHRRMLADGLGAAGCDVRHIMEGGRIDAHRLTRSARIEGDRLVYDVPEDDDGQRRLG